MNYSYFLRKGVPVNERNDETVAVAYFAAAAAASLCCQELAERKKIVGAKGLPGSVGFAAVVGLDAAAVGLAAVVGLAVAAAYLWRMVMTFFFFPGPLRQ
jgi:hypothetical protein